MDNITFQSLTVSDIHPQILMDFDDRHTVTSKWVRSGSGWELVQDNEFFQWNEKKRVWLSQYLLRQLNNGGHVAGAFHGEKLIGFAALDGTLAGEKKKYANLTLLFVDNDWKRQGIGRELFHRICCCAADMGADKLFISAIPSCDTVEFYFKMGCLDAEEIIDDFVDTEYDRYLECSVRQ